MLEIESVVLQDFTSISTESRARNVRVLPTTIDAGREDVKSSLQQLQSVALDINKLSAQMLVHMQQVTKQDLVDRQKELNNQYLWSQTEEEAMKKELEELRRVKEQLKANKLQDIATLKTMHEDLKKNTAVEITELKKETDRLVIEKLKLFTSQGQAEKAITNSCQYIHEITTDLDAVGKAKRLGEFIAQLQLDHIILNSMVHPETPPEQVPERKSAIEEIAAQFDDMEKDAKKVMEETTQFWGSVIQDEQLDQLTKQLQEVDNHMEILKTTLRKMPQIVSIKQFAELKELQQ